MDVFVNSRWLPDGRNLGFPNKFFWYCCSLEQDLKILQDSCYIPPLHSHNWAKVLFVFDAYLKN